MQLSSRQLWLQLKDDYLYDGCYLSYHQIWLISEDVIMPNCITCGSSIIENTYYCRQCGRTLKPHQLRALGNLETICPNCSQYLGKRPGKKAKCPQCGQFIYIRTRPSDKQRVLVTEAQAKEVDEQWSIVNGAHENFSKAIREFDEERASLRQLLGREPSENDVKWSLLNKMLPIHASQQNWGLFRNAKFELGEIQRKEGNPTDSLGLYLEVCYLDLNGPNNIGGIKDPVLLRKLPPWDPKDPSAELAPGIIDRIYRIILKTEMEKNIVEELYLQRTEEIYNSLRLPLSPAGLWRRISREIFKKI